MEFKNLSLLELRDLIDSGKATSQEVYLYFLDRTKQYNDNLNAFNTLPADWIGGDSSTVGKSLPIAVKDIFCEK